jgi:hypothetical protein
MIMPFNERCEAAEAACDRGPHGLVRQAASAGKSAVAAGLALATLLAGGIGANAAEPGLTVTGPWIRMIIPSRPAAGYFTLANNGATPRQLVGAASPACGSLMLHQSVSKGGVEQMDMVASVPVPAHGRVTFTPGGYHLMCMSPAPQVKPGSAVSVTLSFADGGTLTASFPVRGAAGK